MEAGTFIFRAIQNQRQVRYNVSVTLSFPACLLASSTTAAAALRCVVCGGREETQTQRGSGSWLDRLFHNTASIVLIT